jgi:ligand-binding sensor domain-containing protein
MAAIYKILIFIILHFSVLVISSAQKSNMTFHYLTSNEGLSQNRIRCILRDSRENMWFGTYDGLNKYNGSQVTVYRNQVNNPKSISCERITDILEDAEKNIWVATEDGLNLYVPALGSFVTFKNNPIDNSSISGNHINCIYCDKQHNVWFGIENGKEGLNKWNPHAKTFTHYQITCSENMSLANAVTGIAQDKDGKIWVASWDNGLFCFEPDK